MFSKESPWGAVRTQSAAHPLAVSSRQLHSIRTLVPLAFNRHYRQSPLRADNPKSPGQAIA